MNFKNRISSSLWSNLYFFTFPQQAFRDEVELLSVALEIWPRGLPSEQSLVPPINENFLMLFLEPCDTDRHSATRVLKSRERVGVFLSDYCTQSYGHFRHHSWKKMFGFTGIEILFKVLFMGDWGGNRKECRVVSEEYFWMLNIVSY